MNRASFIIVFCLPFQGNGLSQETQEAFLYKSQFGSVISNFTVRLELTTNTYHVGDPILARVVAKNLASNDVQLHSRSDFEDLEIVDSQGRKLSKSQFGEAFGGAVSFSGGSIKFDAGKEWPIEVAANYLYDLSDPGRYTFRGRQKMRFPPGEPAIELYSPPLVVTLLPPPDRPTAADDPSSARPARSASGRPPTIGRILSSTPGISNPETPTRTSTTSANPPRSTGDAGRAAHPSGPAAQETSGSLATADTSAAARRWLASLFIFFILLGTAWWLCRGRRAGPPSQRK